MLQKALKAFVYSPFVETELARVAKESNNNQKSIDLLLESLQNTRKIKPYPSSTIIKFFRSCFFYR